MSLLGDTWQQLCNNENQDEMNILQKKNEINKKDFSAGKWYVQLGLKENIIEKDIEDLQDCNTTLDLMVAQII